MHDRGVRSIASLASVALACACAPGCAAPLLSRDGQLVFQERGARGATVITANGVEFIDRTDVPQPVLRRSANEPWRPATGFILPPDGILQKTATPVPVQGHGLLVVLRSSDVLIPSWGGEILLRMDAIAPAAAFPRAAASVRPPAHVMIVVDGAGPDTTALADAALENLSGSDRVGIVDATGARAVLPLVAGAHRTLLHGAVDRLVVQVARPRGARDLAGALALARGWLSVDPPSDVSPHAQLVLVVTDGKGAITSPRLDRELAALGAAGVKVASVASDRLDATSLAALGPDAHPVGSLAERRVAIERAVSPPGDIVLDDVELVIGSTPAPARLVEVSGGQSALGLYADRLSFGELYAGEARTEVARVMLPQWVPGEPLDLTVTATYRDVASNRLEVAEATIHCRYSNDIEEIARARHGDVIAYASALAMVRRLHRAFLGSEVDRIGGLRPLALLQARSLGQLARAQHDPALGMQSEILSALLGVIDD